MRNNLLGIAAVIGAGAAMMSADALAKVAVAETTLGQTICGRGLVACLILGVAGLVQGQLRWHPALVTAPVVVRILAEVGAGISLPTCTSTFTNLYPFCQFQNIAVRLKGLGATVASWWL